MRRLYETEGSHQLARLRISLQRDRPRPRDAPKREKRSWPCRLFFSTCSAKASGVSLG